MFCPKCSKELIATNYGLYCQKGDMYLAQGITERINECFILKIDKPSELKFSFIVGGNWFCPDDCLEMIEDDGYVKCPKCT